MKSLITVFAICLSVATTSVHAQTVADGYAAHDAGDYDKAKSIFHSLVDAGDAKAINAIGILYDDGKAYPKDGKIACDWFEKAAKTGFRSAQSNYANCFEFGDGRELDVNKAIYWFEKAAEQDDVYAQIHLLKLLFDPDQQQAIYWGKRALEQNSAMARVAFWSLDVEHSGRKASPVDIACVLVMNGLFDKKTEYCDRY
jgi:TPR repeat protein